MTAGLIASAVIVLSVPVYVIKEGLSRRAGGATAGAAATFVGRDGCVDCHEKASEAWRDSDHDKAMAVANDSSVVGDFDDAVFDDGDVYARFFRRDGKYFVETEGPDGELGELEIAYTFGFEPLQQYLIPFPGGRLQSLTIAWDTELGEWFYLYAGRDIPPDDWLHWTRGGQNWNGMCAECHSTNLRKGYDAESKTFSTTWSEVDVSCEACHGPGSRHVEWAEIPPMARPISDNYELVIRTSGITSGQQVELCAPCHSRRTSLGDYDHTHTDLLQYLVPSLLRDELYHPDGQILEEVYVYASFQQSKMYRNGVQCSDCHDVHSLQLVEEGNDLCLQCHRADAYDNYDHHFHKKIHEGEPSDGALCVKCHMPEQPYMLIDWRADHSIRIPRPDLTLEIGVPNACSSSGCHDDETVEWSAEHYEDWYGVAKKPHYGTIIAAAREGRPEAEEELIRMSGDPLYPAIVRATALSLLSGYPGEESTAALQRALGDEDALVRYTAVQSVSVTPDTTAVLDRPRSDLRRFYDDASRPDRTRALRAEYEAQVALVDLVAPLLFDPVKAVRLEAATRLAGLPTEILRDYQREALEEALSEFEKAMEYSLDFSFAGFNLGNLYMSLGDPQRAERYYRSALEIDDLFYPAKMNLVVLLNSAGRNVEAEALLREVLEDYPDVHEAAYSLGLLLGELGRYEEAAVYMQQAAEGMPDRSRTFYNLGLIQQYLGRVVEAEASLMRALEAEPDNIDYLYALADHYVRRGELLVALELADRMIAIHPDNELGHQVKAYIEESLPEN
jgi:predicted CXXCH cytochrome family protein